MISRNSEILKPVWQRIKTAFTHSFFPTAFHAFCNDGGYERWQARMKEAFPEFTFIGAEQKAFDVRLLNVPVVFVCPGYLSHAVYFRAMEAIRGTETRVVYKPDE